MAKHYTATTADKYELYQLSVQSAENDVQFLLETYKTERGKEPKHFREDFCGTCLLSMNWVKLSTDKTAEGYDIDLEPLEWGKRNNLIELGDDIVRVKQFLKDAREPSEQTPDVRCAQNFSYWVFKTRPEMLDYFKKAYNDLADDGVFIVDLHGGPESIKELEEETEMDDKSFTYVWDQDSINPITSEAKLHIHYRFPDGSEMTDAFTYEWRLWGLTELKELLEDAGFKQVDCYWEGTDEDGESGNGIYEKETVGEACESYVAYLVALK